ncbi:MAG: serine hydrolase [Candidatus Fimisoma sp.]|nr:class A beta-lactamase-related serine hydrolase [Bacillota bacterium]MDD7285465.1 class A beta-lactamase-related serine hydrolase [Bacillota bacterium]MDY4747897.1 serine hydrolase [Candidatus Fimisoma sp.]
MEQRYLEERVSRLRGKIGFYYENLETGETLTYNGDEVFKAASVIKLPVFMCVAKLVKEGQLSWDQKFLVREEDKMPSCGALLSLTGDVEIDIESLCRLMITLSDNTAANMLMRAVGMERLKENFEEMGLKKTVAERELFDSEGAARGLDNYICPSEIAMLLKKIYNREFVDEETSEKIENVLLLQQIRHKIPGYIGRKKKIANKTGEDTGTTHDASVVFARSPFVLVITSNDTDVPETERFIREIALELYEENGEGE